MQELKELQDLRNKMFPPELEFGCEVETKDFIGTMINYTIAGNYMLKISDGITKTVTEQAIIKILGKPLTILDILRMLPDTTLNEGCNFGKWNDECSFTYNTFDVILDLSKDLIKDQPKEAIIQLNKLLCKTT